MRSIIIAVIGISVIISASALVSQWTKKSRLADEAQEKTRKAITSDFNFCRMNHWEDFLYWIANAKRLGYKHTSWPIMVYLKNNTPWDDAKIGSPAFQPMTTLSLNEILAKNGIGAIIPTNIDQESKKRIHPTDLCEEIKTSIIKECNEIESRLNSDIKDYFFRNEARLFYDTGADVRWAIHAKNTMIEQIEIMAKKMTDGESYKEAYSAEYLSKITNKKSKTYYTKHLVSNDEACYTILWAELAITPSPAHTDSTPKPDTSNPPREP